MTDYCRISFNKDQNVINVCLFKKAQIVKTGFRLI